MSHYQSKMVALAKADMEPEKLAELVKAARSHAGGMGKAEKMKARAECPHEFGADGMCIKGCGQRELKSASEYFKAHRLFVELDSDGLTEWVQVTPGPGTFSHPRYGSVKITPDTLNRYVENFHQQVYQEHIPIDAEHKTKLSGALGYYREMKVGHNGKPGVWARIELTERGKTLLDSGGFKYFSPEFYDEWEDPATSKEYKDVITGGAFTTRPFFKDKVLEPLAASELEAVEDDDWVGADGELMDAIYELTADGLSDEAIVAAVGAFSEAMQFGGPGSGRYPKGSGKDTEATQKMTGGKTMSEEHDDINDGVTPEQFAEVKAAADATAKAFAEAQAENKKMAERIEAMEGDARTRRFTEVVTGRGGANDGGPQWFGEPEKHVAMLNKLAKAFGEDSEEVKEYIEGQNATAKAIVASKAFSEQGKATPGASGASAAARLDAKVKAWQANNPGKSYSEAMSAVMADDPQAYAEADREFMSRTNKEFSRPV